MEPWHHFWYFRFSNGGKTILNYNLRYLLYGLGIGNEAVKKYFDKNHIPYQIFIDGDDFPDPNAYDVIVKSSGIKFDTPFLKMMETKKKIVSDLELFQFYKPEAKKVVITGTNGKTTTATLIYKLLESQTKTLLAGNIGIPLFSVIDEDGIFVIEASSFMLHYTDTFHPQIAILLNVFPNHLEYHQTFKQYGEDKLKIVKNCIDKDYIVYNTDDDFLKKHIEKFKGTKIPFSLNESVNGAYLQNDSLYYYDQKVVDLSEIRLLGMHNIANILASIIVAKIMGISDENIYQVISSFKGVEHRMEILDWEIPIINDAKSTNPLALLTALRCLKGKRIGVIAGGKDKHDDFSVLKKELNGVKFAYLYGENRNILKNLFEEEQVPTKVFLTLDQAFIDLKNNIEMIDVLLFSPGSSSLDQYSNFEERGKHFKELVKKWFINT